MKFEITLCSHAIWRFSIFVRTRQIRVKFMKAPLRILFFLIKTSWRTNLDFVISKRMMDPRHDNRDECLETVSWQTVILRLIQIRPMNKDAGFPSGISRSLVTPDSSLGQRTVIFLVPILLHDIYCCLHFCPCRHPGKWDRLLFNCSWWSIVARYMIKRQDHKELCVYHISSNWICLVVWK